MNFWNDSKFVNDTEKFCRTCKKWKPHAEYYSSKHYDSGLNPSCIKCIKKASSKKKDWYAERAIILKQILLRYPCECGEADPHKLVFRNRSDSPSLSARTQWDSREHLDGTLSAQRTQCKRCIGSKKPMGNPQQIKLTEDEYEALLAPYETRLSKALAKGKKSKKRAVTDQFDELF